MHNRNNQSNRVQNLVALPADALNELLENQKTIISNLTHQEPATAIGDWVTEKDAQRILGKKTTTLWYLRKTRQLTFTKVGNKTFYSKNDIIRLLEDNKKRRLA